MTEDLTKLYLVIGAIVVMNIGTIIAVIFAAFKVTWSLSQVLTELKMGVAENKKDINAAHGKIRDLERVHANI